MAEQTETSTTETKAQLEFDIDELFKSTYTKIANWHNDDGSQRALKHLSMELVEDIAGAAFTFLNINYTPDIKMDDETRRKLAEEKEKLDKE